MRCKSRFYLYHRLSNRYQIQRKINPTKKKVLFYYYFLLVLPILRHKTHKTMNMTRISTLLLACGLLAGCSSQQTTTLQKNEFALGDVQLLDGPLKDARDLNIKVLLEYDVDRLLAPFRKEAGLLRAGERPEAVDFSFRGVYNILSMRLGEQYEKDQYVPCVCIVLFPAFTGLSCKKRPL